MDSEFLEHIPCDNCGSSDANSLYSDGHTYCFACETTSQADGQATRTSTGKASPEGFLQGNYQALASRKLREDTCKKFGYRVAKSQKGRMVQVADYKTPDGSELVAQKVRTKDKDFWVNGSMKHAGLFGQHLWRDQGRMVVVTEGEIDALTVSQLQDNKWPVVSLQNGASSAKKAIAKAGQWLAGFEKVVLFFDNDEPGREAALEAAKALPPGKAYIARMEEFKDPNEALKAGQGKKVIDAIWGAKAYRPDGIVSIEDVTEDILKPTEWGLPWWSKTLTEATYGRRPTELYAIGAGTGVGKTDFFTQQMAFDVQELDERIGVISLEQPVAETGKRIAGKMVGRQFHVPDAEWTEDELREAVERMAGKVLLYDHFGETDWDVVKSHIRYMASSAGIRLIYLDHLTAMADPGNERESIETIMKEMSQLAQELKVIIHFISHLATPEGKPHEEGGRVMIRHFKGSRSIGFWSYFMFGLERNQQADDPEDQATTTFRILKDRYTGKATGQTILMKYNPVTGIIGETDGTPFETEADSSDDPF
jgi:twinkle protein